MDRKNLSADPIELPLKRAISAHPTLRGQMCRLYDWKEAVYDPWGITLKYTSYNRILNDRDGSHTVSSAIIQREFGVNLISGLFSGYVIARASSS